MGTQIAGDIGRKRPAEVVIDPLFAKALVLDNGVEKICILSLDLAVASKEWCDRIRIGAEEKFGILKENVTVHVTQNHAAPSLGHLMVTESNNLLPSGEEWMWAKGGDESYHPFVINKVNEIIEKAVNNLQPAHIGVSRGIDGRFAFNRRYAMRDGTSKMLPGRCNPDILSFEGPSDPEVGIALITNDNLDNIAILLHHTCHPVHGYPMNYITSGWPGAWCDYMQSTLGSGCVPLVLNGCCGNVFHDNHLDPEHDPNDYKGMGKGLAQTSLKALKNLNYIDNPVLKALSEHIKIPMRQITTERLEKAKQTLLEHPLPKMIDENRIDWDWWYDMSVIDVYNHWGPNSLFDYEIQTFRIGDLAIVTLGGEPFVQGQLKLKAASPAAYTFVAHMCNYYTGYVPTKDAIERGGYETWTGLGSKLCPDALDIIVDKSTEMLRQIFMDVQGGKV